MKNNYGYFLLLILFAVLFRVALGVTNLLIPSLFPPGITDLLLGVFLIIALFVFFIYYTGNNSDPEKAMMKTILALSLKTLLILVFALILFIGFKKKNIETVILFFILYLGFTLFVVFTLLNTLKKSH